MSSTERIANEMDRDLYVLLQRAERLQQDSRVKGEAERWNQIAQALHSARFSARSMMSAKDRAETQG